MAIIRNAFDNEGKMKKRNWLLVVASLLIFGIWAYYLVQWYETARYLQSRPDLMGDDTILIILAPILYLLLAAPGIFGILWSAQPKRRKPLLGIGIAGLLLTNGILIPHLISIMSDQPYFVPLLMFYVPVATGLFVFAAWRHPTGEIVADRGDGSDV